MPVIPPVMPDMSPSRDYPGGVQYMGECHSCGQGFFSPKPMTVCRLCNNQTMEVAVDSRRIATNILANSRPLAEVTTVTSYRDILGVLHDTLAEATEASLVAILQSGPKEQMVLTPKEAAERILANRGRVTALLANLNNDGYRR